MASLKFSNVLPVSTTQRFLGTGAVQTFTVPAGVTAIRFFLWGAGGIGQNGVTNVGTAGGGAYVEGTLLTSPGTVYSIIVGRGGVTGLANGGGTTGGTSAGGGGFSGIFSASPAANTVIAIAGGGGGSGFNTNGYGGGGGYPNGFSGSGGGSQGGGGTQSAGGSSTATAGSQLAGGNGGAGDNGGGGGGGGWYGGGGGNIQGAGGGGSSTYTSIVLNPITENGTNGSAVQSAPTPPGGRSSRFWQSPLGSAGQNGLVVIGYSLPTVPRLTMGNSVPIPRSQQGTTSIFTYTGSYQTYVVPAGISNVVVYMWGAGGSGNNQGVNGGAGAFLTGILRVTPSETLRLIVGKGGVPGGQNATDAQGFGGSSLGATNSAQGGGRSAIQRDAGGGSYTEIVTVGGGGGAGYYGRNGGAGSYTSQGRRGFDQAYTTAFLNANPSAGGGGGSNTGGQGAYGKTASDGVQFRGGDVILAFGNPNGGGGGGGWYGGGGGSGGTPGEGAPGGGGSSYSLNLFNVSGEDSAGQPAPGTTSIYYPGGIIASGGISNTQNGGDGRIVFVPIVVSIPPTIQYTNRLPIPPGQQGTITTFSYTGSAQSYTVPTNSSLLWVHLWGAGGGGGGATDAGSWNGGAGAYVTGLLQVTPGETLTMIVGLGGSPNSGAQTLTQGGGGGAGSPPNNCSSGGGRSAIQRPSGTDIVVAGAGSGSGWRQGAAATWFGTSNPGTSVNGLNGGGGGTQTAGGAAGAVSGYSASTAGSKGQGGNGGGYASGGGGGWYGGGGGGVTAGNGGTGGAGSSYIDLLLSATGQNGSVPTAPATTSPFYGGNAGAGGTTGSTTGGNGRIVIIPVVRN